MLFVVEIFGIEDFGGVVEKSSKPYGLRLEMKGRVPADFLEKRCWDGFL